MRRLRGDRGAATSLAVALLTPMFVFLAFAAFQAAMWSHARTEARFDLKPRHVAADVAYGTGEMLGWLVDHDIDDPATFTFTGKFKKGAFQGTHGQITKDGELKPTGTITLGR